jgi:methylase of polypeptide subunit release factors
MTAAERKAQEFITNAVRLRDEGRKERVLIENLVSSLRPMFPESPVWIDEHIREAEAQVAYKDRSGSRQAFIDNLVGYTTIEYERDLRIRTLFDTGYWQVKQHVAGLLNAGRPRDKILGILSDTIEWRAYKVKAVKASGPTIGPDDIELDEVEVVNVASGTARDAERLLDFLTTHLGRESARQLAADTVAFDLGFDSTFAKHHLGELAQVVAEAFTARPDYTAVLEDLWGNLMDFISDTRAAKFDRGLYVNELYVVTLAKLLCANVIARRSLNSDKRELRAILNGADFRAKGLDNLVEYDYFGWLNGNPWIQKLLPVAEAMQRGLRSYDFTSPAAEDLFGLLLAQLAARSQRLLLGQEATPPWLAARLARQVLDATPTAHPPRILDMCCGSGSMLIEVVKLAKARHRGPVDQAAVQELSQVAAGFDIDPLAVLLAKINWVVAARDWLDPFDGSHRVSIPVYQADSLFVRTAVGAATTTSSGTYPLELHGQPVSLPAFLVTPDARPLFDALLDRAYTVGMALAKGSEPLDPGDVSAAVADACSETGVSLDAAEVRDVEPFMTQLFETLADLQRERLNGIWVFVLRNSYRPGLVIGQFNGLVSNPPWLALSKLANNPYRDALDAKATIYAVKPKGPAHLHTELATTFVLHAVDHYLSADAAVAVVLPDTILNGNQHEPFRQGAYEGGKRRVDLDVRELWRVESGTFKNEAVVLIGAKAKRIARTSVPGAIVSPSSKTTRTFQVIKLAADRTAWSDAAGAAGAATFNDIAVRQGADVMPRRAIFFEADEVAPGRYKIASIDPMTSKRAYLVREGKKLAGFAITSTTVPARYLFDVLLSKHLVPFDLSPPAKALLPIERGASGQWASVKGTRLATSPPAQAVFDEVLSALGGDGKPLSLDDYFALLDTRRKLTQQQFPSKGCLFVYGAGGDFPCAAYTSLDALESDRLIIDQTLYWAAVDDEDEAVYLSGLFNSDALAALIGEFQARGAFGARHVHELPTKVTPGYDRANPLHTAVVAATKKLIGQYVAKRASARASWHFDPNGQLPRRRRASRQMLRTLPTYSKYDAACRAVYQASASSPTAQKP